MQQAFSSAVVFSLLLQLSKPLTRNSIIIFVLFIYSGHLLAVQGRVSVYMTPSRQGGELAPGRIKVAEVEVNKDDQGRLDIRVKRTRSDRAFKLKKVIEKVIKNKDYQCPVSQDYNSASDEDANLIDILYGFRDEEDSTSNYQFVLSVNEVEFRAYSATVEQDRWQYTAQIEAHHSQYFYGAVSIPEHMLLTHLFHWEEDKPKSRKNVSVLNLDGIETALLGISCSWQVKKLFRKKGLSEKHIGYEMFLDHNQDHPDETGPVTITFIFAEDEDSALIPFQLPPLEEDNESLHDDHEYENTDPQAINNVPSGSTDVSSFHNTPVYTSSISPSYRTSMTTAGRHNRPLPEEPPSIQPLTTPSDNHLSQASTSDGTDSGIDSTSGSFTGSSSFTGESGMYSYTDLPSLQRKYKQQGSSNYQPLVPPRGAQPPMYSTTSSPEADTTPLINVISPFISLAQLVAGLLPAFPDLSLDVSTEDQTITIVSNPTTNIYESLDEAQNASNPTVLFVQNLMVQIITMGISIITSYSANAVTISLRK